MWHNILGAFKDLKNSIPKSFFTLWQTLCFLWLRNSGLLFFSGTLYCLFHQKLFHIFPSEIQSLLQVQAQLALPLWSFLHGTHACVFELLKYFTLLVWHLFSVFYCVATHREACLLPVWGWGIFIHCPWKCWALCLSQNRASRTYTLLMWCSPLLCLWEGHLCIMESSLTKTSLG